MEQAPSTLRKFRGKPSTRVHPPRVGGACGHPQDLGCFLPGHATKKAQGDKLRHARLFRTQVIEGFVHGEDVVVGCRCRDLVRVKVDPLSAATLGRKPPPRVIDEKAPHRFRGRRKKVASAGPPSLVLLRPDEPEIGLMDKCRRLEGVTRLFGRESGRGEGSQFIVDKRKQVFSSPPFAGGRGIEELGDIRHRPHCTRVRGRTERLIGTTILPHRFPWMNQMKLERSDDMESGQKARMVLKGLLVADIVY